MLNSPFNQVGAGATLARGLLKGHKLSFNGIVTNLEKTVSTINQVVPLYNQVKPLISNSKTLINAFKKTKKSKPNKRFTPNQNTTSQKSFDPNIIDATIVTPSYNSPLNKQPINIIEVFNDHNNPDKPFFNLT